MTKHYAASLKGEAHVIENIASCLTGDPARIRKRESEWLLESSKFANCATPDDVFKVGDELLTQIHKLLYLYTSIRSPLEIVNVLTLDDNDRFVHRRVRGYVDINVYSAEGVRELSRDISGVSLGSTILARASTDEALAEAIDLLHVDGNAWFQIFDVIEFLGDDRRIAKAGLATSHEVRRVRQTANHYRHLGHPRPPRLPSNPPTVREAWVFATDILKAWIERRCGVT